MTIEQHLRTMIGDLVLQVAQLRAENDALKEAIQKAPAPEGDKP